APGRRPRPGADRGSPAESGRRRSAAATGPRGRERPPRAAIATAGGRSSHPVGGRPRPSPGSGTKRYLSVRSFAKPWSTRQRTVLGQWLLRGNRPVRGRKGGADHDGRTAL